MKNEKLHYAHGTVTVHATATAPCTRPEGTVLSDVYASYSDAKGTAFYNCERLCEEMNGMNLCITSHTSQFFTVAFDAKHPVNMRPMVVRITPYNIDAWYTDGARYMWLVEAYDITTCGMAEPLYETRHDTRAEAMNAVRCGKELARRSVRVERASGLKPSVYAVTLRRIAVDDDGEIVAYGDIAEYYEIAKA